MARALAYVVMVILFLGAEAAQTAMLPIVPEPQVVRLGKGNFALTSLKAAMRISVADKGIHATTREMLVQVMREHGESGARTI